MLISGSSPNETTIFHFIYNVVPVDWSSLSLPYLYLSISFPPNVEQPLTILIRRDCCSFPKWSSLLLTSWLNRLYQKDRRSFIFPNQSQKACLTQVFTLHFLATPLTFWFWTHMCKPGFEKQMLDFKTNKSKEVGPAIYRALLMKSLASDELLRNFTVMGARLPESKIHDCWILNKSTGSVGEELVHLGSMVNLQGHICRKSWKCIL